MTFIAIVFGIILALVLFAGPLLNLLDFLLGILEGIVEIFDNICYFIGNIFNGAKKVKQNVEQKKAVYDHQLLEQKREVQRKELQNFQSIDELPDDCILLERLFSDFKSRGDQKRGFICLNKAVSLGSHMENELALLYLAGIGTDENIELAKKYQVQYFKREIKGDEDLPKWETWFLGNDRYFKDLEGMRTVAENLIENKNILGIFLLDHVRVLDACFLVNAPDKERETFEKYKDNPYFIYSLSVLEEDNQDLLKKAAYNGCYLAAVKIKHQEMIELLKEYAHQLIKQDNFNYHINQTMPFVDLNAVYNQEYQSCMAAHSLSERLPHYEVILKLTRADFPQAVVTALNEVSELTSRNLKSLNEIKYAYLTVFNVSHLCGEETDELFDALMTIIRKIIYASKEQHYDDYLKKSVELCIDMISVKTLKDEKYLIYYLNAIAAYLSFLPENEQKSYHKNHIIKKCIDKLEQAYSGGINGMIRKYQAERAERDVADAIFSVLVSLKVNME